MTQQREDRPVDGNRGKPEAVRAARKDIAQLVTHVDAPRVEERIAVLRDVNVGKTRVLAAEAIVAETDRIARRKRGPARNHKPDERFMSEDDDGHNDRGDDGNRTPPPARKFHAGTLPRRPPHHPVKLPKELRLRSG